MDQLRLKFQSLVKFFLIYCLSFFLRSSANQSTITHINPFTIHKAILNYSEDNCSFEEVYRITGIINLWVNDQDEIPSMNQTRQEIQRILTES